MNRLNRGVCCCLPSIYAGQDQLQSFKFRAEEALRVSLKVLNDPLMAGVNGVLPLMQQIVAFMYLTAYVIYLNENYRS